MFICIWYDLFKGSVTTHKTDSQKVKYEYESKGGISLPPPYNFRNNHRAAIVMFGYTAFQREGAEYFHGKHTGGVRLLSDYIVCGSMPLKRV